MKKIKTKKLKSFKSKNSHWKILLVFSFLLLFLEIGYAALESTINITAEVSGLALNNVFIESVDKVDFNGVTEDLSPKINDSTLTANPIFSDSQYAFITYKVVLTNASSEIMTLSESILDVEESIKNSIGYEIGGEFQEDETILPGKSKYLTLTYKYNSQPQSGQYSLPMTFNFTTTGDLFVSLKTQTVNLKKKNIETLSLNIENTSQTDKQYQLKLDTNKFLLVDGNNNLLSSQQALANKKENKKIYIMKNPEIILYKNSYTVDLILESNGNSSSIGKITISIDSKENLDETPPSIGPIILNMTEQKDLNINWSRLDSGGSPVVDYVITLYSEEGKIINTYHTLKDVLNYQISNLPKGNYYAIIYGIDEADNSGESFLNDATTESTMARKSNLIAIN